MSKRHQEKWHGFDICYYEDDLKGRCLPYGCKVTKEGEHAFDLDCSVDVLALESSQPGMVQRIQELTLGRARAIIDLQSFDWGENLKRSLDGPRTSENTEISDDGLRRTLLKVFYGVRQALLSSYNAAEVWVDIDGLCMEVHISKNQYCSAMEYLLRKGWLQRWREMEHSHNYHRLHITTGGIDEYEREPSIGQVPELRPERPEFSFITKPDLRSIIQRDYEEIPRCLASEDYKAATVMCGSVMEAVLLDALLTDQAKARQSQQAPKDKKGKVIRDLRRWSLNSMIEVAVDLQILPKNTLGFMSHAVREYRNLIHPAVEIRKGIAAEKEEANASRAALDLIIKNLS